MINKIRKLEKDSKKQEANQKKYNEMSEAEKLDFHKQSMARVRAERIAKRDPNAIVNNLLDKKNNVIYEGVAIGGHIEPANNWYKENTYLLMDLSSVHANGLSSRIDNEIVKPINDYLFERTGTNYVHDKIPYYKGYADVPNVYNDLFHKVCENLKDNFVYSYSFAVFAKEYITEQKQFIDEQIENKEIKVDNDIPMPDEDMPSGSIH